jgi:hypothetical protein
MSPYRAGMVRGASRESYDMKRANHGKELSLLTYCRKPIVTPGMRDLFAAGFDFLSMGLYISRVVI